MRLHIAVLPALILSCLSMMVYAQDSVLYTKLYSMPDKFFARINDKAKDIGHKLEHQTDKYLARLEKEERKLQRKLRQKDSTLAKELFGDISARYKNLRTTAGTQPLYNAYLDSIQSVARFLQQQPSLTFTNKYQSLLNNYTELQSKFNQTTAIKQQLKERKQYLKQRLQSLGLAKSFKKFEKNVYYYRAQVDEYKRMLDDPSKFEKTLLQLATKIPAFQEFFRKNSMLANFFRLPESEPNSAATPIPGLQTRSAVQQSMVQRFGSGPDVSNAIHQNIQSAQSHINQLKNKLRKIGGGDSDADMPDFKPNSQKVKSFWQRVELGANVQSVKGNGILPVTSDLALTAGYKINDKSIAGIGMSYKLGWGENIRNLKITHEGIGLRTFLDVKLKGSFYASGGYEQNYRARFNRIELLKKLDVWQQSALLGVSKKYHINNKFKGKIQLLYDFLHAKQSPSTTPIVFRLGYSF